jgi:outer membrane protein OmpA-like peptidoglycan-associated protein
VENKFFVRAGALFEEKKIRLLRILFYLLPCFILAGCASSEVARDVSCNIDRGVQNAEDLYEGTTNSDIADSYQNASQRAKGAILGGAAGALAGSTMSGIGALPGAAVGAVFGGSYGTYIDSKATLEDRIKNRGINIIVLGDQILIMVPSERLFENMSSRLKQDAYSTIKCIAMYINGFTTITVKISAYTDNFGSCAVNLSLSQEQANRVAKELTAYGVNARILYAMGYGGTHLVQAHTSDCAGNARAWDGNDNYRIEITLEKLYV